MNVGLGVLATNAVTALVAVMANWPSQFGQVGTDATSDVLTKGTALSAPLLPMAMLVVSVLLIRAGGLSTRIGLAGFCLVAALLLIGGLGEAFAPATRDTPQVVLISSGVVWGAIAVGMLSLAVAAFREERRACDVGRA